MRIGLHHPILPPVVQKARFTGGRPLAPYEQAMVDRPELAIEVVQTLTRRLPRGGSTYWEKEIPGAFNIAAQTVPLLKLAVSSPQATLPLLRRLVTELRLPQAGGAASPPMLTQLADKIERDKLRTN